MEHRRGRSPICRDPLAQCGQETSLAQKRKLFSADRGHRVPAPEGGMSGQPAWSVFRFCACWSLWLAGPGAWLLAPVLDGSGLFRECFTVKSEADLGIRLQGHQPKSRTYFGSGTSRSGETRQLPHCLLGQHGYVAFLGLRFALPGGVAAPKLQAVAAAANSVGEEIAASGQPSFAAAASSEFCGFCNFRLLCGRMMLVFSTACARRV